MRGGWLRRDRAVARIPIGKWGVTQFIETDGSVLYKGFCATGE